VNVPWTGETAVAIGADWLLAAIAPAGAFGRAARGRERAFRRGDEAAARTALAAVGRVAAEIAAPRLAELRSAIARAPDITSTLVRAQSGATLGDVDFFEIARFIDALDEVARRTAHAVFAAKSVPPADPLLREALARGRSAARTFYLADALAPELGFARGEAARAQAVYDVTRGRATARIAQALGRETLGDDTFTVMRDALPAPLPAGLRIVREAPSYVLCNVACDVETLAALAARDAAADEVARAEQRVRERLSGDVARAAPSLAAACDALGDLDALVARAAFAERHRCVVPEIAGDATVAFTDGRYLPLAELLAARARPYTPLTFELAGSAVVTGPNMGGKTAALRTLGFVVACTAVGVPVPAASARVPLVDEVAWLGIGAGGGEETLLSSFGREVVGLHAFLDRAAPRGLALIDEFARTTSPREGRALLVALLERLRALGGLALVATHLVGVAEAAGAAHYATRGLGPLPPHGGVPLTLDAALARIEGVMDYRLVRSDERAIASSDALALAGALGLDPALIARAEFHLRA